MTTSSRLTAIHLQNFRGTRDPLSLDLDASVVLFVGPNGTGKTTVFDAIMWLLLGEIPRLAAHTMRRTEDYVVSTYSAGGAATVSLDIKVRGELHQLSRKGDSKKSTLTLDGLSIQSGNDEYVRSLLLDNGLSLTEALTTSGLLQQDDLRLLLRDKPNQRYRQLLRLLGLEVLERFETRTSSWHNAAKAIATDARSAMDRERSRLTEAIESATALMEVTSQTVPPADREDLISAVRRAEPHLYVNAPSSDDQMSDLSAEAGSALSSLAVLGGRISQLAAVTTGVSPSDVLAAHQRWTSTQATLEVTRQQLADSESVRDSIAAAHSDLARLAEIAIPFLLRSEPDEAGRQICPVCESHVDGHEVSESLSRRASGTDQLAVLGLLIEAQRDALASAVRASEAAAADLRRANEDAAAREEMERDANSIAVELRTIAEPGIYLRFLRLPQLIPREIVASYATALLANKVAILEEISALETHLIEIETHASRIHRRTLAARQLAERSSELPRIRAGLSSIEASLAHKSGRFEDAAAAESAAADLNNKASLAIQQIFSERFSTLEPLMNDIYARLDPHPTFRRLDFRVEPFRSKGTATATVTDEEEGVVGNPLIVFSSAQANIVVLSAFLALSWASAEDGLSFVLLDDPLQSLDDVNVLGFADLMREIRTKKQLVVSTHEERFAGLIERKLRSRDDASSIIVHRFTSWNRGGPTVDEAPPFGVTNQVNY